jgi:hypothetical protein
MSRERLILQRIRQYCATQKTHDGKMELSTEKFQDTNKVIRISKSTKNRQHNDRRTDNTMTEGQTIQ